MNEKTTNKKSLTIALAVVGVVIVGLLVFFLKPGVSAQPAPTATVATVNETEAPAPTATQLPPTATTLPSPTATSLPSPTPIPPLAVTGDGMTVWCYTAGQITAPPSSEGLATAPKDARMSTLDSDVVQLQIPNYSCNYVFHFNQKAPEGLKLEVYDWYQKQPIFSLAVAPATDDPSAALLVTRNTYLTAPPVWEYTYRFILKDAGGAELWNKQVHMDKGWRPAICLAGVLPNPKTLRCPLRQDSHPWDPWYGKTPVPNDDDNPIP